jgi:tRNA A22 N-methylase
MSMASDKSREGYDLEDFENDTNESIEGLDTLKKIAITVTIAGIGAYVIYKVLKK